MPTFSCDTKENNAQENDNARAVATCEIVPSAIIVEVHTPGMVFADHPSTEQLRSFGGVGPAKTTELPTK